MIAVLWLVFGSMPALAHRVTLFAWVDGDTIHTQSKIGGGKPIKNSPVIVYDPRGVAILEGKTDENGMYSFKIPQKTDLRVVLNAAMGHSAEWTIRAEEIAQSAMESHGSEKPDSFSAIPPADATVVQKRDMIYETPKADLTKEEIEAIVNSALDKKLQPVVEMLAKAFDRGPGPTEIIGGIGYIIGLVGIVLFVTNRRKKTND